MTDDEAVKQAHSIALMLEESGCDGSEACLILSIAMGITLECRPGSHREMLPLAEVININAQRVFDRMRTARIAGRFGHA